MKVIQSQHGLDNKMKFVNKLKSNCFRDKISRFCASVYHFDYKNAFKLIHILFVFALIRFVCGVNGTETTTMCPNCQLNATVTRELAMMNIQSKLLDALGYTNVPESRGREKRTFLPLISKFMEMYNVTDNHTNSVQNSRDTEEVPKLQRQEEIIQGEQLPPGRHSHITHNSTPIKFNLANLTSQDFINVSLMLYVNNSANCKQMINVTIYQLIIDENHHNHYRYKLIRTTETVPDHTWIQVDVTNELQNLHTVLGHKNDTILSISLSYTTKKTSNCPELDSDKAFQHALLKFQYDDRIKKRSKRTAVRQDCTEEHKYNECCRYPIEVDFDEMKWDFIISPRKYNAFYCAGDCPLTYNQNHPYTYIMQQQKTRVGPCCTPKKLNPISMLYFTNRGTILYAKVSNMVVESCGCA